MSEEKKKFEAKKFQLYIKEVDTYIFAFFK